MSKMKKSTFVATVMGLIGGVLFAFGMNMVLVEEWNMVTPGIISGVAGIIVLAATVMVWRKMENKPKVKLNAKAVKSALIGIVGVILFGVGMCLSMVGGQLILGVLVGLGGMIVLLSLIPFVKGLQ